MRNRCGQLRHSAKQKQDINNRSSTSETPLPVPIEVMLFSKYLYSACDDATDDSRNHRNEHYISIVVKVLAGALPFVQGDACDLTN